MPAPAGGIDVERAVTRELNQDLADVRKQLHAALLENKMLRGRLRCLLNCIDAKCSLCAACLEAVRDA